LYVSYDQLDVLGFKLFEAVQDAQKTLPNLAVQKYKHKKNKKE
jgi:hypothetical protein